MVSNVSKHRRNQNRMKRTRKIKGGYIEKINDSFKLPISYNEGKVELNKNIITI